MSAAQVFLAALALAAISTAGGIWAFQTYGVHSFDPTPTVPAKYGLPSVKVVQFASEDGATIHAWISVPVEGNPVILSFYGNQSNIGASMGRIASLIGMGYGVVMMEYRGSGATSGKPSEMNFARDARSLYDQLDALIGYTVPPQQRVLHGFSLGAGVGSRLAANRPFAAVILEAAPLRTCLYYQDRYFGIPFCELMWAERYDVVDHVKGIQAPTLFIHGELDRALPVERARLLYQAAPMPKKYVELAGGGHADLQAHGLFPAIEDFLTERLRVATR
ncbi:prolyl oligopeptidase family serine peptidase [Rhizobium sp. ARZ01]|uniref:alpha/beta hydrolase n=1 Tax=Rhizobium sp. ARZ01 TaxID=2769313 RepID=UPI001782B230|nr:alpha/beta fold hydrolase [Rhizobium sp. ARZ01]MBD9374617.1 prolyl oligopeptidase family serine peptidase [Rhizobium sp. ARZ01]